MKKRFSEEQIVQILSEATNAPVAEVCRKHGVSGPTFYVWKRKYSGMGSEEVKELKGLKDENGRLKRLLAERDLEVDALKDLLSKNV